MGYKYTFSLLQIYFPSVRVRSLACGLKEKGIDSGSSRAKCLTICGLNQGMREMRNAYKFGLEIVNGRDRCEDPWVHEGITLKSILKEIYGGGGEGGGSVDWIRLA
jgi:hypothetical protein